MSQVKRGNSRIAKYTETIFMKNFISKNKHETLCKNYTNGDLRNVHIPQNVRSDKIFPIFMDKKAVR